MTRFHYFTRGALLGMTILALVAPGARAAETNQVKPPAKKEKGEKSAHAFHGKLKAVDKSARSISVGKSTYYVTAETHIQRSDKPTTLESAVVGEEVRGYVKPGADGKMVASSLTFGPKNPAKK
jgi:hypothetical protein